MANYYSSQPLLAWIINTYFYNFTHYVFVAPFYPYRLPNPSSSSPLENYKKLYQPWRDQDVYDEYVAQKRIGLRKGVMAKEGQGILSPSTADRLKSVCDGVNLRYFCPIVYRVDIETIPDRRLIISNSGLQGSDEFLIRDLAQGEFEVLFFDYQDDSVLSNLYGGNESKANVLLTLENDNASTS